MIGRIISHYRIIEKLGEGGMGAVYRAEDTKLDRIVALKFLPNHLLASDQDRTRFVQEAKSASALNHPNVATVYEIDETSGQMFIAMEFVEGQTLRDVIRAIHKSPLPLKQAIDYVIQIADGLAAAHRKGIVHRDVKPENIVFTAEGVAKITDFGLAQPAHSNQVDETEGVAGTVSYMSPEQVQGSRVDGLTDIWSLGVVFYEMITGRRPFIGEYDQAVMYAIVHEKHPPISGLRKDVPGSLEKIIDRCLEKMPALRFPDVSSLLAELRKIKIDGKSSVENVMRSIAVLPFADLSPEKDNKYFSDGLTEEVITNLSKLRNVKVISRTSMMRYERLEKTIKQIAAELSVQYLLEGSVRKQGSDLRITTQLIDANQDVSLWAEKYNGTMDQVFDIQEKVASRVVRALKLRLTPDEKKTLKRRPTKNTEAYQLYLKGRFFWNKRNKEALLTSIRYFQEAIEKDGNYALAWAGLADAYNLLSEYSNVARKETYPKAKVAVEKALELDPRLAEAHASLASLIMLNEWDWTGAEKEFKLAIQLNPNYSTAHHWYAEWLIFMGRIEEALSENSLAVQIEPLSPAILKDMGLTLYYARQYDEAIEYAKKTLELDPEFAAAHRLLSLAYQAKGMFTEAIAENERWMELAENGVEATIALAQLQAAAGNKAEALRLLESSEIESFTAGVLLRGVALVYASLGDKDQALTWLEKAFQLRSESLSSIRVDPKFDILKSEPRFIELMKNVRVLT